jgi:hypothetical protein
VGDVIGGTPIGLAKGEGEGGVVQTEIGIEREFVGLIRTIEGAIGLGIDRDRGIESNINPIELLRQTVIDRIQAIHNPAHPMS